MAKKSIIIVLLVLALAALYGCQQAVVVSFDTNGGTEIQDITVGEGFKLPDDPTKTDYMFAGWYLDKGLTQEYSEVPTTSCTLYAKWISLKWTVTLDAGEGTVNETTKDVMVGQVYTLPTASREGYYFDGWYDAATGGTKYADETGASIVKWVEYTNKTLYAQYSAIPVVSFETNGGTVIADKYADSAFTMPEDPVRAGYEFIGWYKQNNTNEKLTFTSYEQFTQNTTIYAQWRSLNWTITLDAGEGTVSETSKNVTIGQGYTLPTASRTGYYFVGWFDAATGGTKYSDETGASVANWTEYENKTLYAQYSEIPVVSFETNGGTVIADKYADSTFTMPADPVRAGYEFIGWYTEDNTDNQFVFTSVDAITASITLYAQWDWIPVDVVVDDFASYTDTAALQQKWSPYNSTIELVDGKMVVTATQEGGQVQIEIERDFSDLKSFQMTFATGANNGGFQVVFNCNDNFPYRQFVGNGQEQTVAFTFDTFEQAPLYQGYIGYLIIKLPNAGDSITISKVELLVEEKTLEVAADPEDQMLYNFDALADDDALASLFNADAGTKVLVEGKDAVGKAMNFSGKVGSYLSVKNWSNHRFIKFDFKTSANNVFFYLQFADGSNYPCKIITGNGTWQTAVVSLDNFTPLNMSNVTCLYLNCESGSVTIDNIEILLEGTESLPAADPEDMTLYDFENYADDTALQTYFQSAGGTATLVDGQTAGKAMNVTGGQIFTYTSFKDWSDFAFISILYKTSANNVSFNLQMDDGTSKYPLQTLVGNGTWQTAVVSLDRFNTLTKNNITVIFFTVETGSVIIDDIRLLISGTEYLPVADDIEPAAWENFDYLDSAALQAKWSSEDTANPVLLNTEVAGHKSAVISASSTYKSIFAKAGYNWSKYNTVTICFKAPTGSTFYFKATEYTLFPYYLVTSTSEDWQVVTFKLSEMNGGDTYSWGWVASLQLQNESSYDILIDYIDLSYVAPTDTKVLVDDFSTYQTSEELAAKWAPYNATTELVDTDGQKTMKVTSTANGAQASMWMGTHDLIAAGYKSVTLTFRTSTNKSTFEIVLNADAIEGNEYPSLALTVTGSGEWQTVSIPLANMTGYTEALAKTINAYSIKPASGTWVEISSFYFDKEEVSEKAYYYFEDGTSTGWDNATATTLEERTVLTSTDSANGYYFQARDSSTPSSNVFHNVTTIRICAKIENGQNVSITLGDSPNHFTGTLTGTGDWEVYEFTFADLTANGTANQGWIPCFQFANWGGSQYYVDYIMLTEMA